MENLFPNLSLYWRFKDSCRQLLRKNRINGFNGEKMASSTRHARRRFSDEAVRVYVKEIPRNYEKNKVHEKCTITFSYVYMNSMIWSIAKEPFRTVSFYSFGALCGYSPNEYFFFICMLICRIPTNRRYRFLVFLKVWRMKTIWWLIIFLLYIAIKPRTCGVKRDKSFSYHLEFSKNRVQRKFGRNHDIEF